MNITIFADIICVLIGSGLIIWYLNTKTVLGWDSEPTSAEIGLIVGGILILIGLIEMKVEKNKEKQQKINQQIRKEEENRQKRVEDDLLDKYLKQ